MNMWWAKTVTQRAAAGGEVQRSLPEDVHHEFVERGRLGDPPPPTDGVGLVHWDFDRVLIHLVVHWLTLC